MNEHKLEAMTAENIEKFAVMGSWPSAARMRVDLGFDESATDALIGCYTDLEGVVNFSREAPEGPVRKGHAFSIVHGRLYLRPVEGVETEPGVLWVTEEQYDQLF
jgi:hypothetical protein